MKTNHQFCYLGISLGVVLELSTSLIGGAERAAHIIERSPELNIMRPELNISLIGGVELAAHNIELGPELDISL